MLYADDIIMYYFSVFCRFTTIAKYIICSGYSELHDLTLNAK